MWFVYVSWLLLTRPLIIAIMPGVRMRTEAKVPALIVFGDSSADAGNNNQIPTIARSNFAPYGRDFPGGKPTGRFSNGRIATDFISEALGVKPMVPAYLDPGFNISDFATGVTFASAAGGYDNLTSTVLSVMSLWKQLEEYKSYQGKLRAYLGDEEANERISDALHLISTGTNDYLENYYAFPARRSTQFSIEEYEDLLVGIADRFVKELHGLGARKISLGGLPPMGCLPLERTTNIANRHACVESYNRVASQFNNKLEALVAKLNQNLTGIQVVFSNPFYVLMRIIQAPSSYGFEAASVACCATGMFEMGYACRRNSPFTCKDANKYVFWDSFHPTEKTNRIVADEVVRNVLAQFL